MMRFLRINPFVPAILLLGASTLISQTSGDPLDQAVGISSRDAQAARRSQESINVVADETETMLAEYRLILSRLENVNRYNQQMQAIVDDQNREIGNIGQQLTELETTRRDLTPLQFAMLEALEELIQNDIPFLVEERTNRLETLRELMVSSRVTIAERYRRIMEAYQIEMDYARNIEAYTAPLQIGNETKTVNFLRLGRLVLYYQTLDGQDSGIWDQDNRRWVALSGAAPRLGIQTGLRIAQRQAAPDILQLPLPAVR
jgi:hypothetical protein